MTTAQLPSAARATESWLADYLPTLLRLATVLTGDPGLGADLVASALMRERRRATGSAEFAEARLRALVVQRFLGVGAGSPRARLERACLVLRHLEGLTLAETAAVVDRPVGLVAGDLSVDEVYPQQLRARLVELADAAPAPDTVWERWAAGGSGGANRRWPGIALVLLVLVAAGLLLVPVLLPRLPGQTRTPGEWNLVHRVDPPRGWSVLARSVTPDFESTTLQQPGESTSSGDQCQVLVRVPGSLDITTLPTQRDPVRVDGHQGFFSEGDGSDFGPLLAWSYAKNAWALVQCPGDRELDRVKLMSVAQATSFRRHELKLPFTLTSVPAGYRVESATQGADPLSAELILAMTEDRVGEANMAITYTPLEAAADDGASVSIEVNGRKAYLDAAPSHPRLCIVATPDVVCLAAYWPNGDWPARAPLPVNMGPILIRTAQSLQLATAIADERTWFDGTTAIPAG